MLIHKRRYMNAMRFSVVFLLHLNSLVVVKAYVFKCPFTAAWNFRAKDRCNNQTYLKYVCLFDNIDETYKEKCNGPEWAREGYRSVFSGRLTRQKCKEGRFQPFTFWTNGSTDCIYEKSSCNEIGQMIHNGGSSTSDRTCACDHAKGYTYVNEPKRIIYCNPSSEDCTCHLKKCQNSSEISKGYECVETSDATNIDQNPLTFEVSTKPWIPKSDAEDIRSFFVDEYKVHDFRRDASISTLVILFLMSIATSILVAIYILKDEKQTITKDEDLDALLKQDVALQTIGEDKDQDSISDDATSQGKDKDNEHGKQGIATEGIVSAYLGSSDDTVSLDAKNHGKNSDHDVPYQKDNGLCDPGRVKNDNDEDKVPTVLNITSSDKCGENSDQELAAVDVKSHDKEKDHELHDLEKITHDNGNRELALPNEILHDDDNDEFTTDVHKLSEKLGKMEDGEMNYLRLIHLLFRIACPVVRMKFNREIDPSKLQTILNEKKVTLYTQLKKKNRINEHQWNILFKGRNGHKISSEEFDIRLMTLLIGILTDLRIGELRPVTTDRHPDADLTRIKFARNLIIQNSHGSISSADFVEYWRDASQAILRLASNELSHITEERGNATLIDRVMQLNLFDLGDNTLFRLIVHVERDYPNILNQIIKQYCSKEKTTIKMLLKKEKHYLFHLRQKSKKCCSCDKHIKRLLSEDIWKKLYTDVTASEHRNCKNSKECHELFTVREEISSGDLEMSVVVEIILHVPGLLRHVTNKLFERGFDKFLTKHQHLIYHTMSKKICCQCQGSKPALNTTIYEQDWGRLFEKSTSATICNDVHCCCSYKARSLIHHSLVEETLLSSVLKKAGPFHFFNTVIKRVMRCLTEEAKKLEIVQETIEALKELTDILTDCDIETDKYTFSLDGQNEQTVKDNIQNWILRHSSETEPEDAAGSITSVLLRDKDGLKQRNIIGSAGSEESIMRKKTFQEVTDEEVNYLKLFLLLIRIVYPVVREKLNSKCSDKELDKIRIELYPVDKIDFPEEANDSRKRTRKTVYLSQRQKEKLFPSCGTTSVNDFDLKIMICILEHYENNREAHDKDTTVISALETLDSIRRRLVHSTTGLISADDFVKCWDELSKAVFKLGGERYKEKITELEQAFRNC